MKEYESLSIIKTSRGVEATYYRGEECDKKMQVRIDFDELAYPDDFLYACAVLVDRLSIEESPKPFEGKTVCISSPDATTFKVGKIYEWKDGRTVDEKGALMPRNVKLRSLDEITNPELKFIKIVEE